MQFSQGYQMRNELFKYVANNFIQHCISVVISKQIIMQPESLARPLFCLTFHYILHDFSYFHK